MSEQMYKAWLDFLRAETSAHPVLLLLEDLHWSDFGTVRFIGTALRELPDRSWMLLALARPELYEVFPRLWAERQVQEIRLQGLGRRASERLVRQVLGAGVGPNTIEDLTKQADGNALYLEELIRAVAEGKDKDAPFPGTVLAMIETRLARLSRDARRVLRVASVFGEVCWEGGVVALLEEAMGAKVGELLATLVEQELLIARRDSRFPGERELAFRHALLREGAYATLTAADHGLVHRLAGEWLEQRGERDPMVLAGHFERGGQGARAAEFYLRAAEQAIHVLDLDAAIVRTDLGLGCAPSREQRLALLGIRCEVARRLQRVAIDEAEELIHAAPRGSVPWARGMLSYHLRALIERRVDDLGKSLALLQEVTPAPGAAAAMSLIFLTRVFILDTLGQLSQSTALEEPFRALIHARAEQEPLVSVWWHVALGLRSSHAYDDPWNGLRHGDAIRPVFETIGGQLTFVNMQLVRGLNQWYLGALASAAQTLEGIPAADTVIGMASSLRRFSLSWLYADCGALDQASARGTPSSPSLAARATAGRRRRVVAGRSRRCSAAGAIWRRPSARSGSRSGSRYLSRFRGSSRRSGDSASPRAAPRRRSPPPRRPWRATRPWAGAACSAVRSCGSPTPRRSTRPAPTMPPSAPSPRRGRVSSPSSTRSPIQTTRRASSRTCPRTPGRWPWRTRGWAIPTGGDDVRPDARGLGSHASPEAFQVFADLAGRSPRDTVRGLPRLRRW